MRYTGPYKITSVMKKGVYISQHPVSGKTSKAIGSHLKLYVHRQDDASSYVTSHSIGWVMSYSRF